MERLTTLANVTVNEVLRRGIEYGHLICSPTCNDGTFSMATVLCTAKSSVARRQHLLIARCAAAVAERK
eukprot:1540358-Pleurochrysis_carterae.AAC.2